MRAKSCLLVPYGAIHIIRIAQQDAQHFLRDIRHRVVGGRDHRPTAPLSLREQGVEHWALGTGGVLVRLEEGEADGEY